MIESRQSKPVVILGAGPAGLGAALALGDRAVVLEGEREAGGLCRSLELGGAVFDLGGHSFHTPHPEIRQLVFDALPMVEQERDARCFFEGQWIPFPFQKHLDQINDKVTRESCITGVQQAKSISDESSNFQEKLLSSWGNGVYEHFLNPYNQKLWKTDLTTLASDWTRERIPSISKRAEHFETDGGKRTPLQANTMIAYPAEGAFGEIFMALAKRIKDIHFGQNVFSLDVEKRQVTTSQGSWSYEQLVSSLNLQQLLQMISQAPWELKQLAGRLKALPITLVMLAIDGRIPHEVQRIYNAGPETPAHKTVFNHTSSPYLRGLANHGILAEVSGNADTADDQLIEQVKQGLVTMGFSEVIQRVAYARVVRILGYPVPTHDRANIVQSIRSWLQSHGIMTVGRFGEWAYINSDEALYRGFQYGKFLDASGI